MQASTAPAMARLGDTLASMGTSTSESNSRTYVFGTTFRTCAICLDEYQIGDTLRVLDSCGHCFHSHCIENWTRRRSSCPICNTCLNSNNPVVHHHHVDNHHHHHHHHHHHPNPPVVSVPRVQLIDLSVHDSWLEWFVKLVNRRGNLSPQDNPPLSLAAISL